MPGLTDDLSVDIAAAAAQTQTALAKSSSSPEQDVTDTLQHENLEATISDDEVADLLGEEGDNATEGDDEETDGEDNVSKADGPATIKYKANGEDVEISLEEAQQKLALVDGARKAITDAAKLRKESANLKKENAANKEIVELWNKLEAVKDDDRTLYKMITGRDFDQIVAAEAQRLREYEEASPEKQAAMDAQREAEEAKKQLARKSREDKKREEEAEAKEWKLKKQRLHNHMENEALKYNWEEKGVSPAAANRLKKMHWLAVVADVREARAEGKPVTASFLANSFKENAAALRIQEGVVAETKQKEAKVKEGAAKEKAKAAATKNFPKQTVDKSLTKMDPLKLFRSLTGRED